MHHIILIFLIGVKWSICSLLYLLNISATFTLYVPLPLCPCSPGWGSEGVNRTWRQLGRTHWADLNNAGIWREAQKSQPFFIPAVWHHSPPSLLPLHPGVAGNAREKREAETETERRETGNPQAELWAFFIFIFFNTPGVTVLTSHKETYLRKGTERKKRGREKQHASPPPLCFGARRIER